MQIQKIRLKKFGVVDNAFITLSEGVTLFNGDNGEGKSTVLKALSILLFNKYVGSLSDYVQWGSKEAIAECLFSHKGSSYQVNITIPLKGSATRYLFNVDTGDYWESSSTVTSKMDEILDVKRAIASTTSFQHQIDLISTTPSERREYLKNIYNLTMKEELEAVDSDIQFFKEKLIALESKIQTLESQEFERQKLDRLPLTSDRFKELQKQVKSTQKAINQKSQEVLDLQNKLSELKVVGTSVRGLESERAALLKELGASKSDITTIEEKLEEVELSTDESIRNLSNLLSTEKIKDLEDAKKVVQETSTKIETELMPNANELSGVAQELLTTTHDLSQEEFSLKSVEEKISQLEDGVCPVCGAEVDDGHTHDMEAERDELIESIAILRKKKEELSSKRDELSAIEKEIDLGQRTIEKKEDVIKGLEGSLTEIEERMQRDVESFKLNREESIKEKKAQLKTTISLHQSNQKRADHLEERIAEAQKGLDSIKELEDKVDDIESEKADLDHELSTLHSSIDLYNTTIAQNEAKIKMNEEIEKKEAARDAQVIELRKDTDETAKSITRSEIAKKILSKELPTYILSVLIQQIDTYSNEFLSRVYPDYRLKFIEKKSTLSVVYGENEVDVKLASGFEQQIFSFAYKYALGKLQNYGVLILDEADSSASDKYSELFYSTLGSMQSMFNQILVISHKPAMKDLLREDYNAKVFNVEGGRIFE